MQNITKNETDDIAGWIKLWQKDWGLPGSSKRGFVMFGWKWAHHDEFSFVVPTFTKYPPFDCRLGYKVHWPKILSSKFSKNSTTDT